MTYDVRIRGFVTFALAYFTEYNVFEAHSGCSVSVILFIAELCLFKG